MEERNYKLYVHISPNGKRYYGITNRDKCEYRWNSGKGYYKNKHFTNAINKYGWDNFEHIVLFNNLTKEEACLLEQMYIALYDTMNPKYGYNNTSGGEHYIPSEESRRKNSEAKKGKQFTEEHKNKISEARKGIQFTEETKRKLSESRTGKHHTEESKRKISENRKGKYKGKNNPVAKAVLMFTLHGQFIRKFDCIVDAYEYLGKKRNSGQISRCINGINKTAYGYIWKYEEDYIKEQEQAI